MAGTDTEETEEKTAQGIGLSRMLACVAYLDRDPVPV